MSIFPLFLLWGVATSRHISYYDDDTVLQPIMTRSQERRICAELCMSGLGGTPCGDDCVDITPQGLPIQFASRNSTAKVVFGAKTRQSACPLLCENQLGFPLCNCDGIEKKPRVDFVQVCGFYCVNYSYQIYGCQKCDLYKNATKSNPQIINLVGGGRLVFQDETIDWGKWCNRMCGAGEGGPACNCDLLPMSLKPKMI